MSRATLVIVLSFGIAAMAPAAEPPQKNPFAKPAFMTLIEEAPALARREPQAEALSLQATLVAKDKSFANIGGIILAPGEEHDGYRLVSVREGAAVLERNGERIELMLFQESEDE